jgi:hypothetical protein
MRPCPTLIAQPIEDMTRTAITVLLEQAATSSEPAARKLLFAPRLVERGSCAPPGWVSLEPATQKRSKASMTQHRLSRSTG